MVEVFKTDVIQERHAIMLLKEIHSHFPCVANFDLDDCDKILRVKSADEIETDSLIRFLDEYGFHAEVLPDVVYPTLRGC